MQPHPPIPYTPDKSVLRRQLRAARLSVPPEVRQRAGKDLLRHALRHRLLAAGKRVGFYIPANGEIDVMPLLLHAYAMGVHCYLPIVPGRGRRKLWFSRLDQSPQGYTSWPRNRFGIPEYPVSPSRYRRGARLQQIFVPLLGFDRRGYRLGMGGGYYDSSMAFRLWRGNWHAPRLIGVAYAAQEADQLPNDPWDVPLDGVLTERGLLRTCPQAQ